MPYSHALSVSSTDERRAENYGNLWRLAIYGRISPCANTIGTQDEEVRPRPFQNAKIFTVPAHLREVRPAAYDPLILVMGPYHRDRESAEIAECKIFSARQQTNPKFLELHEYIHKNITKFTEMYDRKLEVEPECLSLMLTLDACLLSDIISEYVVRHYPRQLPNEVYDNYVLPRRHFWTILRDLMLMENQIPMDVLKEAKVGRAVQVGREESDSEVRERESKFETEVYELIKYAYPFRKEGVPLVQRPNFTGCHHLLEYFYRSCTHKYENDKKAANSSVEIPTATQLRAAGIRFRAIKRLEGVRESRDTIASRVVPACLLALYIKGIQICKRRIRRDPPRTDVTGDLENPRTSDVAGDSPPTDVTGDLGRITFEGRTLRLPMLKMYSESETWFRNLMAYEQCRNDLSVHWCSYMRLMGCLIDTAEDVKLLTKKEVLMNLMGSNEAVAKVWNSFGVNVELFLTERDKEIMDRINEHCKCTRKVWFAEFYSLHFSRPWSIISFLAAVFLLGMTLLQTICRFHKCPQN